MLKHVPNILTSARFVLTFIFFWMILHSEKIEEGPYYWAIAFVLFFVTGLTDIIDGKIARKYNVSSKLGRIMDPLADKVLVCGTFVCFAVIGKPRLFGMSANVLALVHWSIVAILLARELYVTAIRQIAESKGINFAATASGKFKMFTQSFAIGTLIIKTGYVQALWGDYFTSAVLLLMIIATIYSGIKATQRKVDKYVIAA